MTTLRVFRRRPGAHPSRILQDAHFPYGKEQVYPGGNFDYHLVPFGAAFKAGTSRIMPYYGMPIDLGIEETGFGLFGVNRDVITGHAFGRANPYLLLMKKLCAILVIVLLLPDAVLLAGGTPEVSGRSIMIDADGVAAHGADVVAFYDLTDDRKAVSGKPEHSYEWKGAVWRFAGREDLDKFRQNPEKYAPQYGGYCAYAMADGKLLEVDPGPMAARL